MNRSMRGVAVLACFQAASGFAPPVATPASSSSSSSSFAPSRYGIAVASTLSDRPTSVSSESPSSSQQQRQQQQQQQQRGGGAKEVERQRLTVRIAKPLGLVVEELEPSKPTTAGARVKSVRAGGSAEQAGVKAGDVLLSINGVEMVRRPFGEIIESLTRSSYGVTSLDLLRLAPAAATAAAADDGAAVYSDVEAADAAAAELSGIQFPLRSSSSSSQAPAAAAAAAAAMSTALPFLECPSLLRAGANAPDYAGNFGFDPLRLAKDKYQLAFYREAEIKHARLAMMAAAGWPVAELWDSKIAAFLGLPSVLDANDGLNPALLNGGLFEVVNPYYWAAVLLATSAVEGVGEDRKRAATVTNAEWLPGDLGFDPLGFYPSDDAGRRRLQLAEVKHGRLAMVAVVGFVAQEALLRTPVVAQTPLFFAPPAL